jgi:ABC-type Zn uptake system ZnuABC Zn-binding protein ZnuA
MLWEGMLIKLTFLLKVRTRSSINNWIEVNNMQVSLQTIYDNLEKIDRVDPTTSAIYRQSAQEVLADPEISLEWRKAISDRLNQVNHELTVHAHVDDDSY